MHIINNWWHNILYRLHELGTAIDEHIRREITMIDILFIGLFVLVIISAGSYVAGYISGKTNEQAKIVEFIEDYYGWQELHK